VSHPSVSINRDDATHGLAQASDAANGVHDLAQQVLICDRLGGAARPLSLHLFAAELLDLRTDSGTERGIEGFP
jgi:hypothetical protein